MATTQTSLRRFARLGMMATCGSAFLPLCGCAAGSSASFTQAPLLFAEQTDSSGTAAYPAVSDQAALVAGPQVPATSVQVGSAISGGDASLPTSAITSVTRPLGGAIAQLTAVPPVSVEVAPGDVSVAVGAPASVAGVQASVSSGTIAVAVQTGVLPPIGVQTNIPGTVGATATTIAQLANSVPVVSTVLQSPPVAGLGSAVRGTVGVVGSTATALLQPATTSPIASIAFKPPVVPAGTAVGVAQSVAVTGTSLLTATSAALSKICVLKGCR